MRRQSAITLAITILVCPNVHAMQPLITDDTGTQGSGGNQIEFSYNHDRTNTSSETIRVDTVPLVYTRGLTETLDMFAGLSYSRIRFSSPSGNASGYGSPSAGVKWRFYEDTDSKTSLAIKPEILFPVSSARENAGLGDGKTSGNLTLILTQEVSFGAINFNAGVGRDRFRNTDEQPDASIKRASIAPVWEVNEQWKLALDAGVESVRAGGDTVRFRFVELGTVYSPHKDLEFALGVIRTSDNANPDSITYSATAGVTLRF